MIYTVKEVSEKIEMSAHTIRYYSNLDLIPSLEYSENGNRLFNDEAINWLICIRFLRNSGMPIAQIKEYFSLCLSGNETIEDRYTILVNLLEESEKELERIRKQTECIAEKVEYYKTVLAGENVDDCNPINWT